MKRREFLTLSSLAAVAIFTPNFAFSKENEYSVKCVNGEFIGMKEAKTGVISFKGIPFAKAPVGDLRWLPPQELEPSDEKFEAKNFCDAPLQNLSQEYKKLNIKTSEDCLKINIWASDLKGKNRPVMFYIHGGAFAVETAAEPAYDAQFMVAQNPDIIVVTMDYRLNTLGFADLSRVPGYDEKYKHAPYLGLLDDIVALKWVQKNIAKFGGNPNNVTIFGQNAGGGSVSELLVCKEAKGLFKRAIAQSGALNLTFDKKRFEEMDQIGEIMKATGAKNMDDLLALKPEQFLDVWKRDSSKTSPLGSSSIENLYAFPLRGDGSIIPADPYRVLEDGFAKDIELMIGTTSDEWRYFAYSLQNYGNSSDIMGTYYKIIQSKRDYFTKIVSEQNQKYLDEYFKILDTKDDEYAKKYKDIWKTTEFLNDLGFRLPAILEACAHTKGGGKTYMYYFCKTSDANDWIGAAHASERNYVFNNTEYIVDYIGTVDKMLAKKISTMWANFARTGDPSLPDFKWTAYNEKTRATMVVSKDGKLLMQSDPKKEQRELLEKMGIDLKFVNF